MNTAESQTVEWKESWQDDVLKTLCGFANAEGGILQIGRSDAGHPVGLPHATKLLEDLPNSQAGNPPPRIDHKGIDLWTDFPYPPDYLAAVRDPGSENELGETGESSEKSSEKILSLLSKHPEFTIAKLANTLGMTTRGVEKQLRQLQESQRLRRIGPAKGGHWEVLSGASHQKPPSEN